MVCFVFVWVPASAGMTLASAGNDGGVRGNDGGLRGNGLRGNDVGVRGNDVGRQVHVEQLAFLGFDGDVVTEPVVGFFCPRPHR